LLDPVTKRDELLVDEVLDSGVRVYAGRRESLAGARAAHAVDVGQCDLDALLARQIDSNETCHLVMVPFHSPRRSGTAPIRQVSCRTTPGRELPVRQVRGSRPPGPGVASAPARRYGGGCCFVSYEVVSYGVVAIKFGIRLMNLPESARSSETLAGSALTLLVTQVLADHHDPTVTADHLALVTDLLDARLNLHVLVALLVDLSRTRG